jgi:hypothetical protein
MRLCHLFDDNILEIASHLNDVDCTMWALSCRWAYGVPALENRRLVHWEYLIRAAYRTGTRRQCAFVDATLAPAPAAELNGRIIVRWQGHLQRHAAMSASESRNFWGDRPRGLPCPFIFIPNDQRCGVLLWMVTLPEQEFLRLRRVLRINYPELDEHLLDCETAADMEKLSPDFRKLVERGYHRYQAAYVLSRLIKKLAEA